MEPAAKSVKEAPQLQAVETPPQDLEIEPERVLVRTQQQLAEANFKLAKAEAMIDKLLAEGLPNAR